MMVKELEQVVVRFSGDSGDGMQLAGNIFSTVSATVGNDISTFPDYPADIRAPQGSLTGVSGFQVHIGAEKVYTPGDKCDVLVAMNAAALKTQYKFAKSTACIIIDTDAFQKSDLEKAAFKTDNPIEEMGIKQDVIAAPYLEDGERLPCRHRNGQQVHAEMPQYVCSRPGMLAVQPRSENSRRFHPREIRQKARNCRGKYQGHPCRI